MAVVRFWQAHSTELAVLLRQHLVLVGLSTGLAVFIAVPAGILAARRPGLGRAVLSFANVAQTVPSLALLGFLLPLPFIGGIGARTALVALTLYALLPIVRTTVTGLRTIDPAVIEAGTAMGMTPRQLLWMVELPLAMPQMVAGIRVATVIGVGTATIAAAIGAGGLGEYIFRGLAMVDTTTILAGAIPAAALALLADAGLAYIERRLRRPHRQRTIAAAAATIGIIIAGAGLIAAVSARGGEQPVVIGSKNFTEQVILGELLAQMLEAEGVPVERRLNLGGTFVCDRGLRSGDLDLYVEYTGTAVAAIFRHDVPKDPALALQQTRELYAALQLTVLPPLGFNNTFTILVRGRDARQRGLRTIEDLAALAPAWTPGFGHEFLQRQDGYRGLVRTYGLTFGEQPRGMELSLIYRALASGQVDVIAGDATSGLIHTLDLTPLEDTRRYFPPYHAVPVVRTATLRREPRIAAAVSRVAGRLTADRMRALNAAVDVDKRRVPDVAREFIASLPPR